MENLHFDWLDADVAVNYSAPGLLTSDSPRVSPAGEQSDLNARLAAPVIKDADPPSGDCALPLLRLSNWDSTKLYNIDKPECIHYDFRWKMSQREKIRARQVCSDTEPNLVLAPSDFWKITFEPRLAALLKDEDKWPGYKYTCEETIVDISIERSRQRGLKKRFKGLEIDWRILDSHMEGLGALFSKKRKITFGIEFVFKEVTGDSSSARGKKKGQSATEAQKLQRAADAGLKEGEKEEEVEININIPPTILKDVLDDSRKRKAEDADDFRNCKAHVLANCKYCDAAETTLGKDPGDIEGDRMERLEEYCAWNLQQVKSDKWRQALQDANQFALDQFLELNSILQHPKVAADLMVKGGVKPGIALQFVSSIRRLQQEIEKP